MNSIVDEKIDELIDEVLDIKEKISNYEMELESKKDNLLSTMKDNKKYDFVGEKGSAKIISYIRESLIKDEVLNTFDKVNKGQLEGEIKAFEHIKQSPVYFVLVKEKF